MCVRKRKTERGRESARERERESERESERAREREREKERVPGARGVSQKALRVAHLQPDVRCICICMCMYMYMYMYQQAVRVAHVQAVARQKRARICSGLVSAIRML